LSSKTKVLITGAAGKIGSILIPELVKRYDVVLTDIREPATQSHPFIKADITDMRAMQTICEGMHTVLHLAADPRDTAPWESLLPNNIVGTYTIFQAAHEASCQRVVFASSGHTVSAYPNGVQIQPNVPVRPANLYGATKVWGEAVARFYADQKGLSCICLRLGWVQARDSQVIHPGESALDQILTYEDLAKLIVASIEAPVDLRFGLFYGISNNHWKRFDLSNTRAVLGYEPEDDAFALAGVVRPTKLNRFYWRRFKRWFKRHRNN
jgi:uronate dehydrogenase